jgi:hypothetical protein
MQLNATEGNAMSIHISHVEVTRSEDGEIHVAPFWTGVDRPMSSGWAIDSNEHLAARLERAILAGAVHSDVSVKTDVNGRTYVSATTHVVGRRMSADLKRLGF